MGVKSCRCCVALRRNCSLLFTGVIFGVLSLPCVQVPPVLGWPLFQMAMMHSCLSTQNTGLVPSGSTWGCLLLEKRVVFKSSSPPPGFFQDCIVHSKELRVHAATVQIHCGRSLISATALFPFQQLNAYGCPSVFQFVSKGSVGTSSYPGLGREDVGNLLPSHTRSRCQD